MNRLATQDDARRLAQMRWDFRVEHAEPLSEAFEEFAQHFESFFAEALASNRWFIWVAEIDRQIVSHIFVYLVPKVPKPNRTSATWGYVTNVYSDPSVRGQGVGSELLRAVIEWGRTTGLELLVVWPSEDSVDFYTRAGFAGNPEILERKLND